MLDGVAGGIAAAVALAVGELVTAADRSGASLVTAVGDEVIDRFGGALVEPAVSLFGTNDKVALVTGIVVVAVSLGAVLGVEGRQHPWLPAAGFALAGALGWWSWARAPLTSAALGGIACVAAAAAGSVSLRALQAQVGGSPRAASPASADVDVAPRGPGTGTRRQFLALSGGLGGVAVASALVGRRLRGSDATDAARASVVLPEPVEITAPPSAPPVEVPGLSPYITPSRGFYRIDTALVPPRIDPARWRLDVTGRVEEPLSLTYAELLAAPSVEVPVTLQCVSNEVGGDLVGTARWQGVLLRDLLERARPLESATQVVGRSVDGFTAGFPTEVLADGRSALVAYAMNGEPLPVRHGFPARLVVAGLYGYVSATKWLREIELTGWDDFDAYWVVRSWAKEGSVKIASRIDVPRPGEDVAAGPVAIAGVAWAPNRGVRAVEVRIDDGPWRSCELGPTASPETWVQWWHRWEATPGEHVLRVRAIDAVGDVQTDHVAPPHPDGATGLHTRRVTVR